MPKKISLKTKGSVGVSRNQTTTKTTPKTQSKSITPAQKKLLDELSKKFGENTVTLGVPEKRLVIQRIRTGSLSLDIDLGGGIPCGRYTEIAGPLSSTKTTTSLHILRNAQKMGKVCALIDAEGTTDPEYLERLGIDPNMLYYSRPDSLEEAAQLLLDLQKSGVVQVGLLDSIAALGANKENDSEMQDTTQLGVTQKLWGEFFRKYQMNNNRLERDGNETFTLIGLNQLREKIGVMYGDPEYSPGGRAKGFTASVELRFRTGDWIYEGKGQDKKPVGQVVKYKITKNKTYARMRSGEFDFYFEENEAGVPKSYVDNQKEIVVLGYKYNVIERSGGWFKYNSEKYQGLDSIISALKEQPHLLGEIREKIYKVAIVGSHYEA